LLVAVCCAAEAFMFRKILVANDLSDASLPPLRAGLELARRFGASVTVIYVTMPPYPANHWYVPHIGNDAEMLAALSQREQEAARASLERSVRDAVGDASLDVTIEIKTGLPADTILETAEAFGADLIVVGTHGRHGVERLLLGSVAERVSRKARCSVLTVHVGEA
jgi:nucleotide-binding universal stress UspA family protein